MWFVPTRQYAICGGFYCVVTVVRVECGLLSRDQGPLAGYQPVERQHPRQYRKPDAIAVRPKCLVGVRA